MIGLVQKCSACGEPIPPPVLSVRSTPEGVILIFCSTACEVADRRARGLPVHRAMLQALRRERWRRFVRKLRSWFAWGKP